MFLLRQVVADNLQQKELFFSSSKTLARLWVSLCFNLFLIYYLIIISHPSSNEFIEYWLTFMCKMSCWCSIWNIYCTETLQRCFMALPTHTNYTISVKVITIFSIYQERNLEQTLSTSCLSIFLIELSQNSQDSPAIQLFFPFTVCPLV